MPLEADSLDSTLKVEAESSMSASHATINSREQPAQGAAPK
jgi:hypothetical protein